MTTPGNGHDLGLSEAQEQRAAALSASYVVVDLLASSPAAAAAAPADVTTRDGPSTDGPSTGEPPTRVTARRVDVDPSSLVRAPQPHETWSTPPVARTVGEIRAAARDGLHVVHLGARAVPDPATLDALHRLGLRTVGLGASNDADLAGGEPLADAGGLTAHGHRLLRQIDRLGIVVDVAGAGRVTVFDVAMRAARPIVASRVALPGERSGDPTTGADELRAIASADGVIGVGCGPPAPAEGRWAGLSALLDRIDAVAACVGSRYVALGLGDSLVSGRSLGAGSERSAGGPLASGRSVDVPALTHGLVARGYADDEILGILGENALRVFAAVWG